MKIGRKVHHHGGNGKLPGGIPIMRPHHKDGLNTDRTVKPEKISESSFYLWHELLKEFGAQFTVNFFGNSQRSSLSPTGCVKEYISSYRKLLQKWLCKIQHLQELHHDQCGQQS